MAIYTLALPSLGEGIYRVKIQSWLKQPSERVERDEPIFEVETDKADLEIPSPYAGFLRRILVPSGSSVSIRQAVAILSSTLSESLPSGLWDLTAGPELTELKTQGTQEVQDAAAIASASLPLGGRSPTYGAASMTEVGGESVSLWQDPVTALSPYARKLLAEAGVCQTVAATIGGSGLGGRVTGTDIEKWLKAKPQGIQEPSADKEPSVSWEPASSYQSIRSRHPEEATLWGQRKLIAERMRASFTDHLHLTTFRDIDFLSPIKLKEELKTSEPPVNISITALLIYGVSRVIGSHELLTTAIFNDCLVKHDEVHLGVVMAYDHQLIVPVIHHADRLSLTEINSALAGLSTKAMAGRLSPADLEGGVFTITNPGMYGCQASTAIIYGHQSCILSAGELGEKWLPKQGSLHEVPYGHAVGVHELTRTPFMPLGLTFDHRIIDGKDAGRFLRDIEQFFSDVNLP